MIIDGQLSLRAGIGANFPTHALFSGAPTEYRSEHRTSRPCSLSASRPRFFLNRELASWIPEWLSARLPHRRMCTHRGHFSAGAITVSTSEGVKHSSKHRTHSLLPIGFWLSAVARQGFPAWALRPPGGGQWRRTTTPGPAKPRNPNHLDTI